MYPQNEHPVARCQQMRRKIRKFPATATEAKTQEKLKQKILVELRQLSIYLFICSIMMVYGSCTYKRERGYDEVPRC